MLGATMNEPISFGKWLEQEYLKWMAKQGGYRHQNEFAAWLEVDPTLISHYMNDRRKPNNETKSKLAAKLGDGVYLALGEVPPELQEQITRVPPDLLLELEQIIENFLQSMGFRREE